MSAENVFQFDSWILLTAYSPANKSKYTPIRIKLSQVESYEDNKITLLGGRSIKIKETLGEIDDILFGEVKKKKKYNV